eukprot:TRINITY_DN29189_c0_g1_i1.p1 TRINITY_DN29189_c0_g1~~TRINITY_DN29189_c0_g1_i1.p1  ORF type:complete len:272 (-),score=61.86 TRINITY_DN29189_c0_g1_i1:25-840(-)
MAEETMRSIAEYLVRNRKAKKADMMGGPYKGTWVVTSADLRQAQSFDGKVRAIPPVLRSQGKETTANLTDRLISEDVPGNSVVSQVITDEYIKRLIEWRRVHLERSSARDTEAAAQVHELLEYLTEGQRQTNEYFKTAEDSRHRAKLIEQGFSDREQRYRANLAQGKDHLLDYAKEYSQMQATLRSMVDLLSLHRDDLEVARDEFKRVQRHTEDDEDRNRGRIALLSGERKELERRLKELEDKGAHLDAETKMLRKRAEQVREGVVNELET